MSHKRYREDKNCLNCGAIVEAKFCTHCGQENLEVRENFFHIAIHVVADFFHYDSKFLRSIKALLLNPGLLTREYIAGRRVRYIHPLRLFFFITIVMVIVANMYYRDFGDRIKEEQISYTNKEGVKSNVGVSGQDYEQLEPANQRAVQQIATAYDSMAVNLKYWSFVLLPLYALGFSVLYFRRRMLYVEHIVYTLHLQSFVYILLIVFHTLIITILPGAFDWYLNVVIIGGLLYISLKYLHGQSWIKTIFKSLLALVYSVMITAICAGILVALRFI